MKFSEAINRALHDSMSSDSRVIAMGLGLTDPKGIFGTTIGLEEKFGKERAFDTPTSENAITGIATGLAISGYRTVLTHQRLDFALLSIDQIYNNAAKIKYMFGGKLRCPLVIRMMIGRGWGQGPTHSQNLQMMFSGIPGLKVAIPFTAQDAYSQLRASIDNESPTIFLEHRWLHGSEGNVQVKWSKKDITTQNILSRGSDITIVAVSYMNQEALKANSLMKHKWGISADIISFRNYSSVYISEILESVRKTGKILFVDTCSENFSVGPKIFHDVRKALKMDIKQELLALKHIPEPTSYHLTKNYYNYSADIVKKSAELLGIKKFDMADIVEELKIATTEHHDIPAKWFKGPF